MSAPECPARPCQRTTGAAGGIGRLPGDDSLPTIAEALLRDALTSGSVRVDPRRAPRGPGERLLLDALAWTAQPRRRDALDLDCGFVVRGTRIADVHGASAATTIVDDHRDLVSVDGLSNPAASVLLRFGTGTGAVLPAIRGFVAGLTYRDGELIDVAYEPSARSRPVVPPPGRRLSQPTCAARLVVDLGLLYLDAQAVDHLVRAACGPRVVSTPMVLYAACALHECSAGLTSPAWRRSCANTSAWSCTTWRCSPAATPPSQRTARSG